MNASDQARGLRLLQTILADRTDRPFRKRDLTEALVRSTNYRRGSPSKRLQWAQAVAALTLADARDSGLIRRHGHIHWVRCHGGRTLLDGTVVDERAVTHMLPISTQAPEKWLAVDAQTGEVWRGTPNGWARADASTVSLLKQVANTF